MRIVRISIGRRCGMKATTAVKAGGKRAP